MRARVQLRAMSDKAFNHEQYTSNVTRHKMLERRSLECTDLRSRTESQLYKARAIG